MAKTRINDWGDAVILKLSFTEAAALRALLARVSVETDEDIHEATYDTFIALDNAYEMAMERDTRLWPFTFEAFAEQSEPLVSRDSVEVEGAEVDGGFFPLHPCGEVY